MPSFSIKELFRSTALIAVGTAMIAGLFKYPPEPGTGLWRGLLPVLILWCGGWGMVGAGLFALYQRIWTGVLVGVVLAWAFVILFVLTSRVTN
jgi:hypothetical protein